MKILKILLISNKIERAVFDNVMYKIKNLLGDGYEIRMNVLGFSLSTSLMDCKRVLYCNDVYLFNNAAGFIEVYSVEKNLLNDNFSKGKIFLLDSIAEQIGFYIGRVEAEKASSENSKSKSVDKEVVGDINDTLSNALGFAEIIKEEIKKEQNSENMEVLIKCLNKVRYLFNAFYVK